MPLRSSEARLPSSASSADRGAETCSRHRDDHQSRGRHCCFTGLNTGGMGSVARLVRTGTCHRRVHGQPRDGPEHASLARSHSLVPLLGLGKAPPCLSRTLPGPCQCAWRDRDETGTEMGAPPGSMTASFRLSRDHCRVVLSPRPVAKRHRSRAGPRRAHRRDRERPRRERTGGRIRVCSASLASPPRANSQRGMVVQGPTPVLCWSLRECRCACRSHQRSADLITADHEWSFNGSIEQSG
jgi:hypothetical protein